MEIILFFTRYYKEILILLAFSFIFVITYRATRLARETKKGFKEIFTLDGFIIFIFVFLALALIYFLMKRYII